MKQKGKFRRREIYEETSTVNRKTPSTIVCVEPTWSHYGPKKWGVLGGGGLDTHLFSVVVCVGQRSGEQRVPKRKLLSLRTCAKRSRINIQAVGLINPKCITALHVP